MISITVVIRRLHSKPGCWRNRDVTTGDGFIDPTIKAYREGKLPFPDGTIIAALHYRNVPSDENNKVFGQAQSFVPGPPTNVQFMVKDSKMYAATGGWGYGHFNTDGKPGDEALLKSCAPCHAMATRDSVFTRYAP